MTPPTTPTIFGRPWGHFAATVYPEVPTYARCIRCSEQIRPDDRGFIRARVGPVDADYLVGVGDDHITLTAIHRECDLADVIGPTVGVDDDHGFDHSHASAWEAERRLYELRRTHGESVADKLPPRHRREEEGPTSR